jgi:flagellar motor switch protein FliN/FliY
MMGGEGIASDELTEMQSSAVAEAMNQMMGGAAGAIAELTGRNVQIAAPGVDIVDLAEGGAPGMSGPTTLLVRTSFVLKVDGLLDTTLMQIMPVGFARLLLDRVASRPAGGGTAEPEVEIAPESDEERHLRAIPGTTPVARPVTFPTLEDASEAPGAGDIALLLDVPLQVTVELGRTQLRIRNVLELVPGSIVELDKLAGEPVDVLVNGKQIARGEVVVIDEEFGVRITEVASQAKRLHGIAVEEA